MYFDSMPEEIITIIFNYCKIHDLTQLSFVCKKFYRIAYGVLDKRFNYLFITNQMSKNFHERCTSSLVGYKSKMSTYCNWLYGRFVRKPCFYNPSKIEYFTYMAFYKEYMLFKCLQMTKDTIWITNTTSYLFALNRTKNGVVSFHNKWITEKCDSYILNIVSCDNVIITNHTDGTIRRWIIDESIDGTKHIKLLNKHNSNHNSQFIDVTLKHIVSCSNNGIIKIWENKHENNTIANESIIYDYKNHLINSIAFDSTGTKLAVNSSLGYYVIYDINTKRTEINNEIGELCKELIWGDSNTIFLNTCNCIKRVDVRTHRVVHEWYGPFYSNNQQHDFSCMSSDNLHVIMTGTYNNQVILWDQRQSAFVQAYDITDDMYCHNQVNFVQFDNCYIYVIANYKAYEFNFTFNE